LVSVRPEGARRFYALDPAGLAALRSYFDQLCTTALRAYAGSFNPLGKET